MRKTDSCKRCVRQPRGRGVTPRSETGEKEEKDGGQAKRRGSLKSDKESMKSDKGSMKSKSASKGARSPSPDSKRANSPRCVCACVSDSKRERDAMSGADVVSAFVCVPKAKVLRWSFDADAVFCARLRLRFPLPLRFPFPFPFPESRRAPTHGASQQHTGRYCSRPAFALKQKKQLRCGVKAKPFFCFLLGFLGPKTCSVGRAWRCEEEGLGV